MFLFACNCVAFILRLNFLLSLFPAGIRHLCGCSETPICSSTAVHGDPQLGRLVCLWRSCTECLSNFVVWVWFSSLEQIWTNVAFTFSPSSPRSYVNRFKQLIKTYTLTLYFKVQFLLLTNHSIFTFASINS